MAKRATKPPFVFITQDLIGHYKKETEDYKKQVDLVHAEYEQLLKQKTDTEQSIFELRKTLTTLMEEVEKESVNLKELQTLSDEAKHNLAQKKKTIAELDKKLQQLTTLHLSTATLRAENETASKELTKTKENLTIKTNDYFAMIEKLGIARREYDSLTKDTALVKAELKGIKDTLAEVTEERKRTEKARDEMLVSSRSLGYYIPRIEAMMRAKGVTVDLLQEMKKM